MKLRVWHIANPPRKPFTIPVNDIDSAKRVLNALAEYDLFVGEGDVIRNLGKRKAARILLAKKYNINLAWLIKYEKYLANMNGGVPCVVANAQGLEIFVDGEWNEWEREEDGADISEILRDEPLEVERWD